MIIFPAVEKQALEKRKIIIVHVKINAGIITEGFNEGVIDNFFVGAQFIEHQKDPDLLADVHIFNIAAFARHRTNDADLL
jgi:hypothetical protein